MTTVQGISRLLQFQSDFKDKLEENGIDVESNKLNDMLSLVDNINGGDTNYVYATTTISKTKTMTFGTFSFIPECFALASAYNLKNQYSFASDPIQIIGSLSLDGLELGSHDYTVEVLKSDGSVDTIIVNVTLTTDSNENWSLSITLPSNQEYYFIGECEWGCMSSREEIEE